MCSVVMQSHFLEPLESIMVLTLDGFLFFLAIMAFLSGS